MAQTLRLKNILLKEQADMNIEAQHCVADGIPPSTHFTGSYSWVLRALSSTNGAIQALAEALRARRGDLAQAEECAKPPHLPAANAGPALISSAAAKASALLGQLDSVPAASSEVARHALHQSLTLLALVQVGIVHVSLAHARHHNSSSPRLLVPNSHRTSSRTGLLQGPRHLQNRRALGLLHRYGQPLRGLPWRLGDGRGRCIDGQPEG